MLIPVQKEADIPAEYQNTPISKLLNYHNVGSKHESYSAAELLIGTCMDFRVKLNIPEKFAYVIRNGGANLRQREFHMSFAFSVANIKFMVVIGHTDCGMVNLAKNKATFIKGLVDNAGWEEGNAERFFNHYSPQNEIVNEEEFTLHQVYNFRKRFPKILIAPMIFKVEDYKLYFIEE